MSKEAREAQQIAERIEQLTEALRALERRDNEIRKLWSELVYVQPRAAARDGRADLSEKLAHLGGRWAATLRALTNGGRK